MPELLQSPPADHILHYCCISHNWTWVLSHYCCTNHRDVVNFQNRKLNVRFVKQQNDAHFSFIVYRLVWIMFILINLTTQLPLTETLFKNTDYNDFVSFCIVQSFMASRCLSFALDRLWNGVETEQWSLLHLFSFCFYFPLVFSGKHL